MEEANDLQNYDQCWWLDPKYASILCQWGKAGSPCVGRAEQSLFLPGGVLQHLEILGTLLPLPGLMLTTREEQGNTILAVLIPSPTKTYRCLPLLNTAECAHSLSKLEGPVWSPGPGKFLLQSLMPWDPLQPRKECFKEEFPSVINVYIMSNLI